jgi:dipeptidase E
MRRLLLISNSTMHGHGYLEHVRSALKELLDGRRSILFVPWALADHDAYADKAAAAFAQLGVRLESIHRAPNAMAAIGAAEAVFVGGGNTFRLLDRLQRTGALAAIAARAHAGMPYVGSSAGTNVATPTIRTTNDMPIVQPASFVALQLVPFQINPHYLDADPKSTHMGETREERLRQFHEENATPVLGLREGCWLDVRGDQMRLCGTTNARLFAKGAAPREFVPPTDLSFLLQHEAVR